MKDSGLSRSYRYLHHWITTHELIKSMMAALSFRVSDFTAIFSRMQRLGRDGVSRRLIERRRPGIVTVEPAGFRVALLHPGIGARYRLHD